MTKTTSSSGSIKKNFVISPHSEEIIFGFSDDEEVPSKLNKKPVCVPTKTCDGSIGKRKVKSSLVVTTTTVVHVKPPSSTLMLAGSPCFNPEETQVMKVIVETMARIEKEEEEDDDKDKKKKEEAIKKIMVALLSFGLPTVGMKRLALALVVKHSSASSSVWLGRIRKALEAFLV